MNQKTAIIIDDEEDARRIVRKYVERYCPELLVVAEANGVKKGLEILENNKVDLLFLDINLGDGTGFDLLDALGSATPKVIFTTAFDDFAVKAFRYHALDYLLKPIEPEDFAKAVENALQQSPETHLQNLQNWMVSFGNIDRKLAIPTTDGLRFIDISSITMLQADSSYCTVYLSDNKSIVVSKPLKYFADKLIDFPTFLRPHKSFIVNMNCIAEYIKEDGGALRLHDGKKIPISRQKKEQIVKEMNAFFL